MKVKKVSRNWFKQSRKYQELEHCLSRGDVIFFISFPQPQGDSEMSYYARNRQDGMSLASEADLPTLWISLLNTSNR